MSLDQHMFRAGDGDLAFYQQLPHTPSAVRQAVLVLGLVAVAQNLATGVLALVMGGPIVGLAVFVGGSLLTLVGWALFAAIASGMTILFSRERSVWRALLPVLAFAQVPNLLNVITFIPVLGGLITVVLGLWSLRLSYLALRITAPLSQRAAWTTLLAATLPSLLFDTVSAFVRLWASGGRLT
jgi:hypothetical protein